MSKPRPLLRRSITSADRQGIQPSPSGRGHDEGDDGFPTAQREAPPVTANSHGVSVPSPSLPLPHYDIELRELSVAGELIMPGLPVQARSLAAILTAIELSGWKRRVAKPLNGRPGGNDPHHLGVAVYRLNHRQSLIDFHADDGAIRWNWRVNGQRSAPNGDRRMIEQ